MCCLTQKLKWHKTRSEINCQCVISTLLAVENDTRTLLNIDFKVRHLFNSQ